MEGGVYYAIMHDALIDLVWGGLPYPYTQGQMLGCVGTWCACGYSRCGYPQMRVQLDGHASAATRMRVHGGHMYMSVPTDASRCGYGYP